MKANHPTIKIDTKKNEGEGESRGEWKSGQQTIVRAFSKNEPLGKASTEYL